MRRAIPAAVILSAFALGVFPAFGQEKEPPPRKVPVARPLVKEIDAVVVGEGTIAAGRAASLRPRVFGVVTRVNFPYGGDVQQGEVLLELDSRAYEAALKLKEAGLHRARAAHERARMNSQRAQALVRTNATSDAEAELTRTTLDEAQAQLAEAEALLDMARFDLEGCRVLAPFAGRLSRSRVAEGEQLSPEREPFATVSVVDPLTIEWSLDESVAERLDAEHPNGLVGAPVKIAPHRGDLGAIEGRVVHVSNSSGGENVNRGGFRRGGRLYLTAELPNPDRKLSIGASADVTVAVGKRQAQLLPARAFAPAEAPTRGPGFREGTTLAPGDRAVVRSLLDDGRVMVGVVTLDQRVEDLWAFSPELPADAKVILDANFAGRGRGADEPRIEPVVESLEPTPK